MGRNRLNSLGRVRTRLRLIDVALTFASVELPYLPQFNSGKCLTLMEDVVGALTEQLGGDIQKLLMSFILTFLDVYRVRANKPAVTNFSGTVVQTMKSMV